jgi:hypothetical protein
MTGVAAFLTSTQSLGTANDWQLAALNPEVVVMNHNDNGSYNKPDWMNPANDRKTPYTEEEIDTFVEDFILGLDKQEWLSITAEHGEKKAREKIRTAFVNMDENSLVNITPKGSVN